MATRTLGENTKSYLEFQIKLTLIRRSRISEMKWQHQSDNHKCRKERPWRTWRKAFNRWTSKKQTWKRWFQGKTPFPRLNWKWMTPISKRGRQRGKKRPRRSLLQDKATTPLIAKQLSKRRKTYPLPKGSRPGLQ